MNSVAPIFLFHLIYNVKTYSFYKLQLRMSPDVGLFDNTAAKSYDKFH